MQEVQLKLLQRCIRDLNALGCTFAIVDAEGNKYGELKVSEPKTKRDLIFKFGSIRKYIVPYIEHLNVGEVAEIPINQFGHEKIQGGTCSWFNRRYGGKSVTSTYNKEKNVLEVMRLA